jgi:putative membrane protein
MVTLRQFESRRKAGSDPQRRWEEPMILNSIQGLPAFLAYFAVGIALGGVYLVVYTFVTAHNEFELIRRNVLAAGLALGLSLIGFAIPLASAIVHSVSVPDMIVWGLIALVVQIAVYFLVRIVIPDLSKRIADNEIGSALFLGAASLAAGLINASSMTY